MTYTPSRVQNHYTIASTDARITAVSTTIIELEGTQVEYTPHGLAQSVLYTINFNSINYPDGYKGLSNTRLQQSTDSGVSWSDIDGCKLFEGSQSHIIDYVFFNNAYTFSLSPWTGTRKLRLASRSKGTDSEFMVNQLRRDGSYLGGLSDGGVGAVTTISMYSVLGAS